MLKIGHRGSPSIVPENTLSGFRKAIELGMEGIELDVHLSKDGELVVIHDDSVDRTTDGKGLVAQLTLAELQGLSVEGRESISTLEQVFEALGSDIHYFVEVKVAEAALPAAKLMTRYIKGGWQAEKLHLISFKHAALQEALKAFPGICIGASVVELKEEDIVKSQEMGARAVLPNYKTLTVQQVQAVQKLGLQVIVWTVNNDEDIARLAAMKVDGIISDYPDRLLPKNAVYG